MPAGATEIFQEGLRIPPVRTWRDGVEQRDVLALLLANSRTPDERVGDLRAQAAANHLIAERTLELESRLGADRLRAAMRATQDHAERSMRAAIVRIPDGTYDAVDVMDGDGIVDEDLPIRVRVMVSGDHLMADFAGTAPQARGSVNAPFAVTVSACSYVLRAVTDPGIPANAGAHRPLTVLAPPGTMVNPLPPAAVAAGNVETSQRIVDVLLRALAQALPDRVPAASQGTMNNVLIGGMDPRTGGAFSYYETLGGGQGARPGLDGMNGVHTHMTNTLNTPVEALEAAYPLRIVEYRLRDGTGGAGGGAEATGCVVRTWSSGSARRRRCSPSGGGIDPGACPAVSRGQRGGTR